MKYPRPSEEGLAQSGSRSDCGMSHPRDVVLERRAASSAPPKTGSRAQEVYPKLPHWLPLHPLARTRPPGNCRSERFAQVRPAGWRMTGCWWPQPKKERARASSRDTQSRARNSADDAQVAKYPNRHGGSDGPGVPHRTAIRSPALRAWRRWRRAAVVFDSAIGHPCVRRRAPPSCRACAVTQPGLRQCAGVRGRRPHFRALPEASRLSNHPVGKDEFAGRTS